MNLEVLLQSPSNQLVPWPGGLASVKQLSWALHGGPENALIELNPAILLDEMAAYLGWKVIVRNRYQTPVWWGFIEEMEANQGGGKKRCLLYTSPSPRDRTRSRMP